MLISEAVRGDWGILYNLGRERFVFVYDERAKLAPRDVVNNLKKPGLYM